MKEVSSGVRTLGNAARTYSIPRQTLHDHIHGRRGKKSTGLGRSTILSFAEESALATGEH
jgi:hypothetical protein